MLIASPSFFDMSMDTTRTRAKVSFDRRFSSVRPTQRPQYRNPCTNNVPVPTVLYGIPEWHEMMERWNDGNATSRYTCSIDRQKKERVQKVTGLYTVPYVESRVFCVPPPLFRPHKKGDVGLGRRKGGRGWLLKRKKGEGGVRKKK